MRVADEKLWIGITQIIIVCCTQGAMKEATETWKSLSVVEKKVQEYI